MERAGFEVVFANDIEPLKHAAYAANFDDRHFLLGDVREIRGGAVPGAEVATASFPCTDLSLAGNRAGLSGGESRVFWEFARILDEMGDRRPSAILLENVVGFATSHGGEDLRSAIGRMNELGYLCDVFVVDARRFVPQSRPRMFIVASTEPLAGPSDWQPSELRPAWVGAFVSRFPGLKMQALPLELPTRDPPTLADVVERLSADDSRWWDGQRSAAFVDSLSRVQSTRLKALGSSRRTLWATAYRRTRKGRAVWEIRPDHISGCLRTTRGGSSKQALVEGQRGQIRVRWMTPTEYARLQGAEGYRLHGTSASQAMFGFGDAVCVPVVEWIAREYLQPLLNGRLTCQTAGRVQSAG
jgi:DNA (cytosine-5)-methyltransferase 1